MITHSPLASPSKAVATSTPRPLADASRPGASAAPIGVPRGTVLSDLLVRFALLAALPLACLADAVVVLVQANKHPNSGLPLTVLLLIILVLGSLLTLLNLVSAAQSVRTINAVLGGLARQALHVASADTKEAMATQRGGEVEWLSQAFRGMVESLHRERTTLEHRLADLEALNRVAGAALDGADAPHYEARILDTAVQALHAAGGVFVCAQPDRLEVAAVAGQEPSLVASLGHAAIATLGPDPARWPALDGPLACALSHGEIGTWSLDDDHLPLSYREHLAHAGMHTALALPLLQQGDVKGAIELYFTLPGPNERRPLDSRQPMLKTVVRLISVGYDHARTLMELRDSNAALERANKLKSEFLAGMSHELRTPMNSIMGYSHVLLDGIDGELNGEQQKDVSRVLNAAESLLAIINDILDLSKIEAGRIELHWQPIVVKEIITTLIATTQPLATAKALPVRVSVAEDVDVVWGDAARVSQVLLNLMSNAIKFTHEGYVAIEVTRDDDRVRFAIRDTGIGIKPEAHHLIFEEFRQADGTTSRRYGGTGLGLAITRRLVEMHGSTVDLVSAEGQGSTFSFTLPASLPQRESTEEALHVEAHANDDAAVEPVGPLALVIEDDQETIHLMRRYLEPAGYRVIGLQSGKDAVPLAIEYHPQVITLDIMLGETDGWQVLQQLKAAPETMRIPVVIVSVLENRSLALALGAEGCLSKPVERAELLSLLHQVTATPAQTCAVPAGAMACLADGAEVVDQSLRRVR